MGILVIALRINPRSLSALELRLSGLIMESRVDTAGDNQNAHVIISNYRHDGRADNRRYRHDRRADSQSHFFQDHAAMVDKNLHSDAAHYSGYILLL